MEPRNFTPVLEPTVTHPQQGATYAQIWEYWTYARMEHGVDVFQKYPETNLDTTRADCTIASRPETHQFRVTGATAVKIQ